MWMIGGTEKKVMKTKSIPNDSNKQLKNGEPFPEVVEKKTLFLKDQK